MLSSPAVAAYVILWDYYVVHNLFVASYGLIHFQEPIRVAAKEMSEAFFFSLMHLKTDDGPVNTLDDTVARFVA